MTAENPPHSLYCPWNWYLGTVVPLCHVIIYAQAPILAHGWLHCCHCVLSGETIGCSIWGKSAIPLNTESAPMLSLWFSVTILTMNTQHSPLLLTTAHYWHVPICQPDPCTLVLQLQNQVGCRCPNQGIYKWSHVAWSPGGSDAYLSFNSHRNMLRFWVRRYSASSLLMAHCECYVFLSHSVIMDSCTFLSDSVHFILTYLPLVIPLLSDSSHFTMTHPWWLLAPLSSI